MNRGNGGKPPAGLEYPCRIDIKVFIRRDEVTAAVVSALVLDQVGEEDLLGISRRESRGGNYLALTCSVMARSRRQMDDLFRCLSGHPDILVVI